VRMDVENMSNGPRLRKGLKVVNAAGWAPMERGVERASQIAVFTLSKISITKAMTSGRFRRAVY
jgi:hypothetical protein